MNSSLSPVSDLVLSENIGKLVEVKNKLDNVRNKITLQNEEMTKTIDLIEKFKNCYNEQKEALKMFTEDHDKLLADYDALILVVQGKPDRVANSCDRAPCSCDRAPNSCDRVANSCDRAPNSCDRPSNSCDRAHNSCDRAPSSCDRLPQEMAGRLGSGPMSESAVGVKSVATDCGPNDCSHSTAGRMNGAAVAPDMTPDMDAVNDAKPAPPVQHPGPMTFDRLVDKFIARNSANAPARTTFSGNGEAHRNRPNAAPPGEALRMSATNAVAANGPKKLKRKAGNSNPLTPNGSKQQRKSATNNKKKSKPGDTPSANKQNKKDKRIEPIEEAIDVLVKVDSFRLEKVATFGDQYTVIHKVHAPSSDVYVCGSHGLLSSHRKLSIVNYGGHYQRTVRDFYVLGTMSIISLGADYVMLHRLNDSNKYETLATFDSEICCSCVYKTKLYGVLANGSIFVVDMAIEKVDLFLGVLDDRSISVVVVKVNNVKLLVVASTRNEIVSYNLSENDWLRRQATLSVTGTLQGMKIYSSSIICYTSHAVLLLDKMLWKISLVREIANNIVFLEADMNHIIVLDNCNILHKYIIKKGRIRTGSTVEYLQVKEKVTAMYFSFAAKKIYFATGNELFNQKF